MGVRENDALGLAVEQNPIGVDAASSPAEGGAETNDMQTQEEIAVEAFRTAIGAVKKVDQTATFRCIYEGDGDRRLNEETGKMEPYPDITCASGVPEDIAGLRKYFEPNFEAMLVDQKGDDDDGNSREDWNITGTGLGKTSVEPRFLHN